MPEASEKEKRMKTRKIIALVLALVMALGMLTACGTSGNTTPANNANTVPDKAEEYGTVTIKNGERTVTFTKMPEKVLCCHLYAAENMVMLGLADKIVAKNIATNPAEVPLPELADYFKNIPEIKNTFENAVSSGADLVIGQVSAFKDTSWGSYEQFENAKVNCLTITGTIVSDETVEDIYTDIRNLGKIFKVESKAEEVIQKMKDQIAATNAKVKDVKDADKPKVFVYDMFKEDQIYTTAAGLESNLIELAGGINTTRKMADSRWFICSVEVLVKANPDIIIINDYGKQTVEEKIGKIKSNPACADIPAVKNDKFLIIPLVEVMQDIRAANACQKMAEYFYPEIFK